MNSIIQSKKECIVCAMQGLYEPYVEDHHVFFGKNRHNSEKTGLKVWLCPYHHRGTNGVHGKNGHDLDMMLKRTAQTEFEKNHSREEFISIFGKNYL